MAADTVAFIEALDIGPAHLIGWSDGAVVALLVAATRPDLVRSLVFVGNALNIDGLPAEMRPMLDHLTPEALPPFLREMYNAVSPDGPEHFDVVFEKVATAIRSLPYVDMSELAQLRSPTLVIVGDRDMVTIEHADTIRRTIPDARLAVLPGSHAIPMEKAALVASVALDFLANLTADR
jgi:pimeloyl-ACP methyl ester carboxylesterase